MTATTPGNRLITLVALTFASLPLTSANTFCQTTVASTTDTTSTARPEDHTAYGFPADNNDDFVLSRLRLNIEVRPTPWFSTFVQAQDSEAGDINPSHITTSIKDVFDLRQAYLQFRIGEESWFRLRIGRQEFRYGQERLIGVSDWTNAPRVFDAVRLVLGPEKAHVDVFTSAVVVNRPTSFDTHPGGLTFHGTCGG